MVDAGGASPVLSREAPAAALVSRDAEPDMPDPETPAIAETLVQQTQEEQMLREAVGSLTPQCRRLVELLFSKLRAALC